MLSFWLSSFARQPTFFSIKTPMLASLRLINLKNHEDTLIKNRQSLSVFVGPNAVGKHGHG